MRNKKISNIKLKVKSNNQKKQNANNSKSLNSNSVINKIEHYVSIIENTILSVQKYKTMDIVSASDLNICISNLEKMFHKLLLLKKNIYKESLTEESIITKLQEVNNELFTIFKNYGTKNIDDVLIVCFGLSFQKKCKDFNTERYNIISKYIHPISFKILDNKGDTKKSATNTKSKIIAKNKIVEDFMIVENANTLECFDLARTSNNFQTKVYGIKIAFQNYEENKTIIISAIIDDVILQCIENPYINKILHSLSEIKFSCIDYTPENKLIFNNYVNSLTLKELLVYSLSELEHKFNGYMSQCSKLKRETISDVVKDFINAELYKQRKILTLLLINENDPECHYLSYLLYDLLSSENNSTLDTYEQTLLFDSLPWNIKKKFKNAMKTTANYSKSLSNFDAKKIPMEQQICLLKTTDSVKEKAMIKLKEVKAKSEDSGSKARQYIEGLLKIPFGIYRKEKILTVMNDMNNTMTNVVQSTKNNHTNTDIVLKNKYTMVDMQKYVDFYENKYIKMSNDKNISDIKQKLTTGKRDKIVSNIYFLNSILKKCNIKNSKICHSGKKISYMTEQIINTINLNCNNNKFMNELYGKFNNTTLSDNKSILANISEIKSQQEFVNTSLKNIRKTLDNSVYGHDNAKRQIERVIGQWITGKQSGYCFGFEGSPGVGKTSLAKNGLSKCLINKDGTERPFAFIAMGGSSNASTLSGHNYTYVGSTWGRIVDILMEKKCMNPIIFIDELDKVSKTEHGKEIIGILTHLVDTTQNTGFQDKYFSGIDLDLSKVLFIFSYNDPELIDRILLDRIHRIKFNNLSIKDKLEIAKNFILPEIYENIGFNNIVDFDDDTLKFIINNYTREAGVRKLKEILFEIISEVNLEHLNSSCDSEFPVKITQDNIKYHYLKERHQIRPKIIHTKHEVGIINGLWANSLGLGGIIPIECNIVPNNNFLDLKLTGMQGDVMKESMNVAKTLAWKLTSQKERNKFFKKAEKTKFQGLHVHCPEGAVRKDGPSAGTAITVCIYSILNNKKIKHDLAITGEINLQGKVTAIGGLDLKIIGGIRAGVKTFLYPEENKKHFDQFMEKYGTDTMIEGIIFKSVNNIKDVLKEVFV